MICKYCKERIDRLETNQEVIVYYTFYYNEETKTFEYNETDKHSDDGTDEFRCPNCDRILAINEKEAIKLLKEE